MSCFYLSPSSCDGHEDRTANAEQKSGAEENIKKRKHNIKRRHSIDADSFSDDDRVCQNIDGRDHSSTNG